MTSSIRQQLLIGESSSLVCEDCVLLTHIIDKRNSHIYCNNTLYMIKFSVLDSSINSKEKSVPCTSCMHNNVILLYSSIQTISYVIFLYSSIQVISMLFMMVSLYIIKYHRLFIVMCMSTAYTVQCVGQWPPQLAMNTMKSSVLNHWP